MRHFNYLKKSPTYLILIGIIVFFFILYCKASFYRHINYSSNAFDLGIYTQTTYLFTSNLNPYSTLKNMNILADHFDLILLFLAPIYKIFPTPLTLLTIQALFVSLSAIPIFIISWHRLNNRPLSYLIILAYLTSIGITNAIVFDFHTTTLSVLPLSLLLLFWYFKKTFWYILFSIISLIFKEDIPLFVFGLGLTQIFSRQKRLGIISCFIAAIGFYLIKFQIMPSLWPDGEKNYLVTSILPITSPSDMFILLVTQPKIFIDQILNSSIKIQTLFQLLSTFAFLSILSPLAWWTVFPYLFLRFNSTYTALWTTQFHHNANLMPFLAVSAVLAICHSNISYKKAFLMICFFLFFGGLNPNGFFWFNSISDFSFTNRYSYIQPIISMLPSKAAISAQSPLVPHLANRQQIYLFPEIKEANYIVLDTSLDTYPLTKTDLNNKIAELSKSSDWKINKHQTLVIFEKITRQKLGRNQRL